MNVKQIIENHLREVGADGLVNLECDYDGCGCSIDDLCPCECVNIDDCQPAKKVDCCACDGAYGEDFRYEPITDAPSDSKQ